MRKLEIEIFNKLNKDFPDEIEVLEQAIDVLVLYSDYIAYNSPYDKPTDTLEDILQASPDDRCLVSQVMLLGFSIESIKAAQLLLLTGYIGPAMSSLRTGYEAFHNAHICSIVDEQAIRFLQGKTINKKVDIPVPEQLDEEIVKSIKYILSNIGVHPSYKSLENQAYLLNLYLMESMVLSLNL